MNEQEKKAWKTYADTLLKAKYRKPLASVDPDFIDRCMNLGMTPLEFANQDTIEWKTAPKPQPKIIDPIPQHQSVLRDGKYLLNTGTGFHCPICGSTNIRVLSKPGTGLGYLGSLSWIVAASLFESLIKSIQKQLFQCGYCEVSFTEDAIGSGYAKQRELATFE